MLPLIGSLSLFDLTEKQLRAEAALEVAKICQYSDEEEEGGPNKRKKSSTDEKSKQRSDVMNFFFSLCVSVVIEIVRMQEILVFVKKRFYKNFKIFVKT